jgi:hypothetical protein
MLRFAFPPIVSSIAFLFAGLLVATADAAEPEVTPTPEAKAHFKAGVKYLRSKSNDEAYREFKAAYDSTPSWKVLGNLGIAADRLERDGEAIDALQEYIDKGSDEMDATEEVQVRRDLERLHRGIATVTLEMPERHWVIDTRDGPNGSVVNRYGPFKRNAELRVRSGQHEFRIEPEIADDITSTVWSVALLPGQKATHSFVRPGHEIASDSSTVNAPSPERDVAAPSHTTAYVLWGLGTLSAAAATVMYVESRSLQNNADDDFRTSCPNGVDRSDLRCVDTLAVDARAANWRTGALLTGVGALGALIGGTILYSLDLRAPSGSGSTKEGTGDATSLGAWVSGTGVGLSGTF